MARCAHARPKCGLQGILGWGPTRETGSAHPPARARPPLALWLSAWDVLLHKITKLFAICRKWEAKRVPSPLPSNIRGLERINQSITGQRLPAYHLGKHILQ